MRLQNVLFLLIILAALGFFGYNVRRLVSYLRIGKAERRTDRRWERLKNVFVIAFGQTKLFREPVAGSMHFLIYWGFIVLLLAVAETIGEGIVPGFSLSFLGRVYPPLIFLIDLFGILVIGSVLLALYRRYISRPKRLEVDRHSRIDATVILVLILLVMVTMFGQNAARIAMGDISASTPRFISSRLASLFLVLPSSQQQVWFSIFWWLHILLVLGFLNYLPYSKHLHILSSVPNVFLAKLEPRGTLKPLNLQDETLAKFGASDVEDFTWKQLLDGYSCTECGRCTAACPANNTGKVLSPRKIIVDMRRRLMEKGPLLKKPKSQTLSESNDSKSTTRRLDRPVGSRRPKPKSSGKNPLEKHLLDDYITEEELWACTSCLACVQECPVQIEHVDAIVDMRRYLVLTESRFPKELQPTFQNLERNYTPWGFSHSSRADWAEDLNIPRFSENRNSEFLYWVGCAGSYDARYKKVARAFASVLQKSAVDFAILGTEEKCTGDPARRAGNEYLAQMLISENVATLNQYGVKKILTTCPHCFNMLKNEYPSFGGEYEVIHHTEFINRLLASGKIRMRSQQQLQLTYHDPCYLGRYNQRYDEPRNLLKALPGSSLIEMRRSRDKGFCCGAGGARMFMEEREGKRVNIERTEEALSLNPDVIGTACPFCMTMLTDGVKEKEAAERVQVKDIAELVLEAIEA